MLRYRAKDIRMGITRSVIGALKVLDASLGADGKSVIIRTESDLTVSDETILDTNRRFRKYLDAVTGYTTKERVKKAKTVE